MKKKLFVILMSIMMVITMMPAMAFALPDGFSASPDEEASVEPTKYNEVGKGTADKPWEISTLEQLEDLAAAVNGTGAYEGKANGMSNKFFKLTADIGTAAKPFTTPIGAGINPETPFCGTFDGARHTVTIDISGDLRRAGLFGLVTGTVKKVYTAGKVDITCGDNGDVYAGGICGILAQSGRIVNCSNSADISVTATDPKEHNFLVGGICGLIFASEVSNCYNSGSISSTISGNSENNSNYVGGLCGAVGESSAIHNCYSSGSVTATGGEDDSVSYSGVCGKCDGSDICFYDSTICKSGCDYYGLCGLVTEQMKTAAGEIYEGDGAELGGVSLVDLLNGAFVPVSPSWLGWKVENGEYPTFVDPSAAELMGVPDEVAIFYGYWEGQDESGNAVALNMTKLDSGGDLNGKIRQLDEPNNDSTMGVYARFEQWEGDSDTFFYDKYGVCDYIFEDSSTLAITLTDGTTYYFTKKEYIEHLGSTETVSLQDFNFENDGVNWTLTFGGEGDELSDGEVWAYMAIPRIAKSYIDGVFQEMKRTLGNSTSLYDNDWGIESYLNQMKAAGMPVGFSTDGSSVQIPAYYDIAAIFVAKVTDDIVDVVGRKYIALTVGGAIIPNGLTEAENEMDFHDLSISKYGGAHKGTGVEDEYADYYWDGDKLFICADDLTIFGETTKESIKINSNVTSLTLEDLSITTMTDGEPAITKYNNSLTLSVYGTNSLSAIGDCNALHCNCDLTITGKGDLSATSIGIGNAGIVGNEITLDCSGMIMVDGEEIGISSDSIIVTENTGKVIVYGNDGDCGAILVESVSLAKGFAMKGSTTYQEEEDAITGKASVDDDCVKVGNTPAKSVLIVPEPEHITSVDLTVEYTDVDTFPTVTVPDDVGYEAAAANQIAFLKDGKVRYLCSADEDGIKWIEMDEEGVPLEEDLEEAPNVSGLDAVLMIGCKVTDDTQYGYYYDDEITVKVNGTEVPYSENESFSNGWAFGEEDPEGKTMDDCINVVLLLDAPASASIAQLTHEGTTTPYSTVEEALDNAVSGDTVALLADITGDSAVDLVEVAPEVTLDLNGHDLEARLVVAFGLVKDSVGTGKLIVSEDHFAYMGGKEMNTSDENVLPVWDTNGYVFCAVNTITSYWNPTLSAGTNPKYQFRPESADISKILAADSGVKVIVEIEYKRTGKDYYDNMTVEFGQQYITSFLGNYNNNWGMYVTLLGTDNITEIKARANLKSDKSNFSIVSDWKLTPENK